MSDTMLLLFAFGYTLMVIACIFAFGIWLVDGICDRLERRRARKRRSSRDWH